MPQKIHPGVVSAIIAAVVLAIGVIAWRIFLPSAPSSPGSTSGAGSAKTRQGTVTRGPDGRLQFSPEAQAQRGPRPFPNTANSAPNLH